MFARVAAAVAVGVTLHGCGCGVFPDESATIVAKGTVSAGSNGVELSGPISMWFDNGNLRQDMSMSAQGMTSEMDQLVVCSDDEATVTAHVYMSGQEDQCVINGPQSMPCSELTFFGSLGSAATCLGVKDCPTTSGKCDAWSVPVDEPQTVGHRSTQYLSGASQVFSKFRDVMLESTNASRMSSSAHQTMQIYFKKGTNQVSSMQQAQYGVDMTIDFDTWDTSSSVAADTFDVPESWEPCVPAAFSGLFSLSNTSVVV